MNFLKKNVVWIAVIAMVLGAYAAWYVYGVKSASGTSTTGFAGKLNKKNPVSAE